MKKKQLQPTTLHGANDVHNSCMTCRDANTDIAAGDTSSQDKNRHIKE